jgi:hypothetical protein
MDFDSVSRLRLDPRAQVLESVSTDRKSGLDLKLVWQPGGDAQADDFLLLTFRGVNMQTGTGWTFQTPWPGQTGALSGKATTTTVPGSLLKPKDTLLVNLTSYRASSSPGK